MTTDSSHSEQEISQEKDVHLPENSPSNIPQSGEEMVNTDANAGEDVNALGKAVIEEAKAHDAENPASDNESDEAVATPKDEMELMKEVTIMETPLNQEDTTEKSMVQENENLPADHTEARSEKEETQKKTDAPQDQEQHAGGKALSLTEIISKLASLHATASAEKWQQESKEFNKYRALGYAQLHMQEKAEKQKWIEDGNAEADFKFENNQHLKFTELLHEFKKIQEAFHQNQDQQQAKNLETRTAIIERLKNLNSNADAGTNLFKEIREIKEQWAAAGQVPKTEFKIINNNYFHHLNQFYEILDLKKDFLEQEHAHNLEKRLHIIARAKELQTEGSVQKALNELQYLHKLWKEEAVPVAEEFREKTWQEFKDISDKIHDRRAELSEQMDADHSANLQKKTAIIEEIKKLSTSDKEVNHSHWQNSIKKIEALREEFLKTGSVSRKLSNQTWQEFKDVLKSFNNAKNQYYKTQKNSQQKNLEDKMKLIQIAKDNNASEDWETMVAMFKNLQQDWKKIGHVPRSQADKIWTEFREACNVFFDNYRDKSEATGDNWKENFAKKNEILTQLKAVSDGEGSVEKIEELKNAWNAIGKVPKDKLSLHTEFNKTLREKLKLNNIHEYELKEEGLTEHQITDKARRIKSQISDMEAELAKLENNLGFFSNPSRDNPLLADTYKRIDDKKENLEGLKKTLHQMIVGE